MNQTATRPGEIPSAAFDRIVVIRLVAAALIFAVALILKIPAVLKTVLLIVSALACGYDIALEAIAEVENQRYLNAPLILILVTLVAFIIGFGYEAAAFLIVYRVGLIAVDYFKISSARTSLGLLQYCDDVTVNEVSAIVKNPDNLSSSAANSAEKAASFVLSFAVGFAVLYAVLVPLFTNYSYTVTIHRAITMLFIACVGSVTLSVPFIFIAGICANVQFGAITKNAAAVENAAVVSTAVVDKSAVAAGESARFVTAQSDILDKNTFMMFVAHAVYYSTQPISRLIPPSANVKYKLDVISNFKDIPGYGVELDIGKAHVIFALGEVFRARGIDCVPEIDAGENRMYYLLVSDRYAGRVEVASESTITLPDLVAEMREMNIDRCILVSNDSHDEAEEFAASLDFDVFRSELSIEEKAGYISQIKSETDSGAVAYIFSDGVEGHSAADVDIKIADRSRFADILVLSDYSGNTAQIFKACGNVKAVVNENILLSFLVKALLIFLSGIGFCNLWMAAALQAACAIAALLNASRISSDSVILKLMRRL